MMPSSVPNNAKTGGDQQSRILSPVEGRVTADAGCQDGCYKNAAVASRVMAEFALRTSYSELPEEVVDKTKECILDWLGSACVGGRSGSPRKILSIAELFGGTGRSTVIPTWEKSSALMAAFVNGACSHHIELDDLHRSSVLHPAAPIISAAFAVAEAEGCSGRELIEAVVVGYEIGIRVGEAVGPDHYLRWHTTATCGTFGAAAAAGKLLGLTEDQMVWCLGNAGSQAAGLWEFLTNASMTKQLHTGKAAMNGVIAAYLAREGFTGPETIFEGDKGFCIATSNDYDLSKLTENLEPGRTEYKLLTNSFKIHATCRHIHSTLDAVLAIVKEYNVKPDDIVSIDVNLYDAAMDLLERKAVKPADGFEARFSIPFCVATAILYRSVGLEAFTPDRITDPHILSLMERVRLHRDVSLNEDYPQRWPAVVKITTDSGVYEKRVDYPRGDSENPLTKDELARKFRQLVTGILAEDESNEFIRRISEIENLKATDLFSSERTTAARLALEGRR
ncbi:MAG: MmgE/PrpD family protein [Armatimonadetes bacterium]|nr:MmgE/PrpD family protein [Armatimonadota bacterium]